MAGRKSAENADAPLVVVFVEGDTDVVFFNALMQYYRSVSLEPVNQALVVNLMSVTRYASKMLLKLENDIIPAAKAKGQKVTAVCCSYDTDVFEQGLQIVDWAQVKKKVKWLGVSGFCRIGVESMMEDWLLDDMDGICSYLKLKQKPSAVKGRTGYDKLVGLFAKAGMKYSKGFSTGAFIGNLNMGVIRRKRLDALKGLEDALGVKIQKGS